MQNYNQGQSYNYQSGQRYDEEFIDEEVEQEQKKSKKKKDFGNWLIQKIFLFLLTILIALSAFSVVSYCWKDSKTQTEITSTLQTSDKLFYVDGDIDEDCLFRMQKFIENLPQPLEECIRRDWVIIFTDKIPTLLFHRHFVSINDYDTSGMLIGGYTFTQSRIVYVNSELDPETIYSSFVHEIGHVVSFEAGSQHGSSQWEKIYRENMDKFDMDKYNLSNEAEFFAACFEEYYNSPDHLREGSEDAYLFINDTINTNIKNATAGERFILGFTNTANTLRVYYYFYFVDNQVQNS
jgi:hypothetical protein